VISTACARSLSAPRLRAEIAGDRQLRSYASAFRQLQLTCLHEQGLRKNTPGPSDCRRHARRGAQRPRGAPCLSRPWAQPVNDLLAIDDLHTAYGLSRVLFRTDHQPVEFGGLKRSVARDIRRHICHSAQFLCLLPRRVRLPAPVCLSTPAMSGEHFLFFLANNHPRAPRVRLGWKTYDLYCDVTGDLISFRLV
jgi:hypothetical protein